MNMREGKGSKFNIRRKLTVATVKSSLPFKIKFLSIFSFIFHAFKKTRSIPSQYKTSSQTLVQPPTTFQVFRNSRFYVPGLLILNFLLLVVIPSFVYYFYNYFNKEINKTLNYTIWLLNICSYLFDAIVYIFLHPLVRKMLRKKFRRIFGSGRHRTSSGSSSHSLVDMSRRKISLYLGMEIFCGAQNV